MGFEVWKRKNGLYISCTGDVGGWGGKPEQLFPETNNFNHILCHWQRFEQETLETYEKLTDLICLVYFLDQMKRTVELE